MNPRRVRAISVRLLEQFRRDRRTLALLFVAPLVILGLLYFLLRGGGGNPAIDVVNLDSGPLGSAVAAQLEHSSRVSATAVGESQAARDLRGGRVAGYVLFPADFSARALARHQVAPEVYLEGSQPGPSGTIMLAVNQALLGAVESIPGAAAAPHLATSVHYLYGGSSLDTLDYFGAGFVGLVVFFLVFVVTIVSFLRERSQGTLERLMASPLRRGEIVLGYMAGFTALAVVQSIEVLLFCLYVLRIYNSGSAWLVFLITLLMAVAAVNLGIFLSMFARTEFQAVQFIPLVIVPQVLLSGIVFPISSEPRWLQYVSSVLPLTYAVNGLRDVMIKGADLSWASVQLDLGVVLAFVIALVAGASATLRRRIA